MYAEVRMYVRMIAEKVLILRSCKKKLYTIHTYTICMTIIISTSFFCCCYIVIIIIAAVVFFLINYKYVGIYTILHIMYVHLFFVALKAKVLYYIS